MTFQSTSLGRAIANARWIPNWLRWAWPFRRGGARSPVDELCNEAELVARYASQAGLLKDSGLLSSLATVNALQPEQRVVTDPAVIALMSELSKSRTDVSFPVVSALLAGWDPHRDGKVERLMSFGFVAASLALMFAVGNLTLNYNLGAKLFASLVELQKRDPGLQFGRLERQLLQAEERLANDANKDGAAIVAGGLAAAAADDLQQTGLAQDASFQYAHELTMLDKELRLYKDQSDQFIRTADLQLDPVQRADRWLAGFCNWRSTRWLRCAADPLPYPPNAVAAAAVLSPQYGSLSAGSMQNFCSDLPDIELIKAGGWTSTDGDDGLKALADFISASRYLFIDMLGVKTMDLMRQNCRLNLNYYSQSLPDIVELQNRVSARMSTYSFIALPALYGALGSLMYFMRRVLDPLLPNPPFLRIVHRVALGALAGMVLAWLWDGVLGGNETFKTVGFGLFTLAFILGFAIDVFFSLLDRLVKLATNGVARIGEG